jgi:hypothetical protein
MTCLTTISRLILPSALCLLLFLPASASRAVESSDLLSVVLTKQRAAWEAME